MATHTAQEIETALQSAASRLVNREISVCVSCIVSDLASAYGSNLPDSLDTLANEAFELSSPVLDYDSAAYDEGWRESDGEWIHESRRDPVAVALANGWKLNESNGSWSHPEKEDSYDDATELCNCEGLETGNHESYDSPEDVCHGERIEPHESEVFEHWIVSNWLAKKLAEHGEKVGDFADKTVWARTCTGQAICMDSVIRKIVKALGWIETELAERFGK